jgi:hypothetical protein
VNEIDIIRSQLELESQHVAEAAATCATAVEGAPTKISGGLLECAGYLEWALARLDPPAADLARAKLKAAHASDPGSATGRWRDFLQFFNAHWHTRLIALDELSARNPPVKEWRATARVDADSMLEERARYALLRKHLP